MVKPNVVLLIGLVLLVAFVPGTSPWFRRVIRRIVRQVTCTESVCSTSYGGCQPASPRPGTCIQQVKVARNSIKRTVKPLGQCRNRGCGGNIIRHRCSCPEIQTCQWKNWGAWTGHVSDGACSKQTRTRYVNKSFRHVERDNNCNGVKTDCLAQITSDSQQRNMCRCKKTTSCGTTAWSIWGPFPGNGRCGDQSSSRTVTPQHQIVTQLNNCNGITSTCSLISSKNRRYCSCAYKECNLQQWSSWTTAQRLNLDHCPVEERQRVYDAPVKYKDGINNCNGVGPQSCPKPILESRDKHVSCSNVAAPSDGRLASDTCSAPEALCGTICQATCNQGYLMKGHPFVTCNKLGNWDRTLGKCQDHVAPEITCPLDKDFATLPNKNYSMITLPSAGASDNTGATPKISVNHKFPMKLVVNTPLDIIYEAQDKAGNKDSCKTIVEVIDTDPPKIVSCPSDLTVTPPAFPYPVIWKEPEFIDNVDGDAVLKYPTHHNGQAFSEGRHQVRILARDRSNNNATCEFVVQVSKAVCPDHNPPRHGSKSCNIHKSGKNETYVCSVKCDTGYHFPNLPGDVKVYDFYVCGEEGNWRGQDKFDPTKPGAFFIPIPREQRPWAECAKITDVNHSEYGATKTCVSSSEKAVIKQEFINSLQSDPVLSAVYCRVGTGNNCVVSNVVVTCDAANEIKIDFKPKATPVTVDKVTGVSGIHGIKTLGRVAGARARITVVNLAASNKMKSLLAMLAKRKNEEKKQKEILAKCGHGAILKTVASTGKEGCVTCPVGTYHDIKGNACVPCPVGQYQSEDGKTACEACAAGSSTVAIAAKNETDCKAICPPGSFSPTGLSTCLACSIGSYQPGRGQKKCIPCPNGRTTKVVGAGLADDCV